ncbi:50S ribosomal protein L10 [Candidatus Kaiserbacteria bacterium]|nr:50S ribosomal protein L10 [Candidatus Kaiserbacteria bacterium]
MAKTKTEKAEIVQKLEGAFKNAASSVFVHFNKVNVAEETAMRRALRAGNVSYVVAKKTLIRRALENLGHKSADVTLDGEVAIAYGLPSQSGGEDITAPARLIHEFGKKLTDRIAILGGIFEGKLIGQAHMREIAMVPPMETLRTMFAQLVNSPRQRFAVVLSKVAEVKQ